MWVFGVGRWRHELRGGGVRSFEGGCNSLSRFRREFCRVASCSNLTDLYCQCIKRLSKEFRVAAVHPALFFADHVLEI